MSTPSTPPHGTVCPAHPGTLTHAEIELDDWLHLPRHRSIIVQYLARDDGERELFLFYGEREISFDEPALFPFAEALAQHAAFRAGDTLQWAPGESWPRLRELLVQLLEEGILERHAAPASDVAHRRQGARPSPLPQAPASVPRSWQDCTALTADLTGRSLPLGHLEMVVPIFRVAHCALDAEGRQVGEANVFPPALRVEVPTEWRTCPYPGSRYQLERPMNVTALRSMRAHWEPMMVALLRIREGYLLRFPEARAGWTVGHLERLATLVLAVPSYQLMRQQGGVGNGELHPALSCLFRVTDGLRMVMHQMLFVPIGEPALPPDTPLVSAQILEYAERNYSFHSEHGVCAGPRAMVETFLTALVDGQWDGDAAGVTLDAALLRALDDMPEAFVYGLNGLQIYATVFSLWPAMARTYEAMAALTDAWPAVEDARISAFSELLGRARDRVRSASFLASEAWRAARDHAYGDMYEQCAAALGELGDSLAERLAPRADISDCDAEGILREALERLLQNGTPRHVQDADPLHALLMTYFRQARAIVREAGTAQARINTLLGRTSPDRAFDAADIDIHNLVQNVDADRVPYLQTAIGDLLDIEISITATALALRSEVSHAVPSRHA